MTQFLFLIEIRMQNISVFDAHNTIIIILPCPIDDMSVVPFHVSKPTNETLSYSMQLGFLIEDMSNKIRRIPYFEENVMKKFICYGKPIDPAFLIYLTLTCCYNRNTTSY